MIPCLWLLGAASAADPVVESDGDYHIGAGDVLRVDVYGESFGGTFVVSSAGEVRLPYCETLPIGGMTVAEAETAVKVCLADGYLVDPQVTVRVEEYRSQRVEVMGAVVKPGVYFLTGESTLRSVLGQAGGIQAEKSVGRIVVSRANGDRVVIPIDELMAPPGELLLARGDSVNIDEGELVWVGGEVQKPGAVGYVDGLTVTQALMKAGGPTGVARLSGAYVVRDGERISVNIKRMLRGKDADLVMQAGDRLVVKESPL